MTMRILLLFLGFLSAILIVGQLVLGLIILSGDASKITAHKHSGYATVAITLIYITFSMISIASAPRHEQA